MCVHFVNRRFCKPQEKAISFCGDLLGFREEFQRPKLPKWGLLGPFIIIIRDCSSVALKLVIRQEILKIEY